MKDTQLSPELEDMDKQEYRALTSLDDTNLDLSNARSISDIYINCERLETTGELTIPETDLTREMTLAEILEDGEKMMAKENRNPFRKTIKEAWNKFKTFTEA